MIPRCRQMTMALSAQRSASQQPWSSSSIGLGCGGKDWNKDKSIRKNLDKAGKTYGCHSCGSKKPGGPNWPKGKKQPAHFAPDHVPPHTTFPDVKKGDRKAKVTPKPPRKGSVKLYPQCHTCSNSSGSMIDKMSKGKTGSCYSENVKANRAEGKR